MAEKESKPDDTLGLCWCQGCLNAATHWGTTPNGERVERCDRCDPHWRLDEPKREKTPLDRQEESYVLIDIWEAAFKKSRDAGYELDAALVHGLEAVAREGVRRYLESVENVQETPSEI